MGKNLGLRGEGLAVRREKKSRILPSRRIQLRNMDGK